MGVLFRLAGVEPRRDHQAEADSKLQRALELQTRLQGQKHKNTENVKRLLGRHTPGGAADRDPSDDEDEAAGLEVEEREAQEYLSTLAAPEEGPVAEADQTSE